MFRIPTVTKNLLIINLIAFIATYVFQLRGIDLADIGGLHFFMASNFQLYQLVTYLFLHASFMHILSNMFGLWMFGCVIENVWGPKKFLFYYITCGIGAGLLQEIAQFGSFYMTIVEQVPIRFSPECVDNHRCLWCRLCCDPRLWYDFPQRTVVYHSLPLPYQGEVVCAGLCGHRVLLGTRFFRRWCSPYGSPGRYALWLPDDTLLEPPS